MYKTNSEYLRSGPNSSSLTITKDGFMSNRSIKKLNESVLESYQILDKYDTNLQDKADVHSKKVKHHLNKMKNDMLKAHV